MALTKVTGAVVGDRIEKVFDTVLEAQQDSTLKIGQTIRIKERADSLWDVIASTTNNGYDVLDGTASGVSLQLRVGSGRINIKAFGVVADGTTDDTLALQAAVNYSFNNAAEIWWPDQTVNTTASISNFHDAIHRGNGILKRGSDLFYISPKSSETNTLYVATTGSDTNDGLSSSEPLLTLQKAADIWKEYAPTATSDWTISVADGTAPDVLARSRVASAFDRASPPDLLLQLQNAVDKRLRRWRATGHVNVDGHDPVAAAHD